VNKRWPAIHRTLSIASLNAGLVLLPFSVFWCHTALLLFILLWLLEGNWIEKITVLKKNIALLLLLGFAAILVAGIFYTENPVDGWFNLEKKLFFFLIPLALATTGITWEEKEMRTTFYLFTCACAAGVMICLAHAGWQITLFKEGLISSTGISYLSTSQFENLYPDTSVFWLFFSYVSLANGISMHPSYFSLYMAFSIVFLLHELLTRKKLSLLLKVINRLIIFLFTVFIICLSSRIIIISLMAIYLLVAGHCIFRKQERFSLLAMTGLVITMFLLLYINPVSRYRNVQEIFTSSLNVKEKTFYKTSTEIRASLWWLAWKSYLGTNPIIGAGTGDVNSVMAQTSREYEITNVLDSHNPHNQYLYILIANGLVGLLVFAFFLLVSFLHAWYARDYLLLAFLFLFCTLLLTETALELQKGIVFFALVFPMLGFQHQLLQPQKANVKIFNAGS
jgi:O-antigen ligase